MASSHSGTDDTFLHWLIHSSWHWVLFMVYTAWFENSLPQAAAAHQNRIHVTSWLERKGSLHSAKDARNQLIIHIVLLALEPIQGYWILTSWYRTFLPVYSMRVPDEYIWSERVAKYLCTFLLPAGLVGWSVVGIILVVWTWMHVCELWTWAPGQMGRASGGDKPGRGGE
ncbi:hypothetical protein BDW59DRAFT_143856 [Aspergillus cavernicola]|uniref:TLC domain-containing protein n=1 Tax=Aspergillus cavernicola TaxID=176166 RepID=A0ABR4IJ74_9EURO